MSILIDKLIRSHITTNLTRANHKFDGCVWAIDKSLNKLPILTRIKDAFRILNNKSFAVHYFADDENNIDNQIKKTKGL